MKLTDILSLVSTVERMAPPEISSRLHSSSSMMTSSPSTRLNVSEFMTLTAHLVGMKLQPWQIPLLEALLAGKGLLGLPARGRSPPPRI